jgi:hypothetical protein
MPPSWKLLALAVLLSACGARTGLPGVGDAEAGGAAQGGAGSGAGSDGGASTLDACPGELGAVTTIDQGLDEPYAMAIDDRFIYVGTLTGTDSIRRYPKEGGASVVIRDELEYVNEIVADGGRIFFTEESGGVRSIDPNGANELSLATAAGPAGLDVSDTSVVFADYFGGTIVSVARDGGPSQTLVSGLSAPYRVALVGDRAFFTSSSPGVQYVATSGGPVSSMSDDSPRSFTATSTHLYWGIGQFGDSRLLRAPLDSLIPEQVADLAAFGTFLGSLASDDNDVFVSINGMEDGTVASIVRVPQSGAAPTLVAPGTSRFGGPVAIDEHCVFWIDQGELPQSGKVLRTRKP